MSRGLEMCIRDSLITVIGIHHPSQLYHYNEKQSNNRKDVKGTELHLIIILGTKIAFSASISIQEEHESYIHPHLFLPLHKDSLFNFFLSGKDKNTKYFLFEKETSDKL